VRWSMVLFAGACTTGPQPPLVEDPVCAVDGEVAVDLPLRASGLDTLYAAEGLAAELLGGEAIWRGNLTGLSLDAEGLANADGQIPAVGSDGEPFMARVGWTSTWCAGDREVALTASESEALAVCGPATEACGAAFAEPAIDAGEALDLGAEPESWFYHAVLYQPRPESVPASLAWQVVWQAEVNQAFRWIDAATGEVLPCGDSAAYGCVETTVE
jgi:hypothetical protein